MDDNNLDFVLHPFSVFSKCSILSMLYVRVDGRDWNEQHQSRRKGRVLTDGLFFFWLQIIVQPSAGKQVHCQHPGTQKYQGFPKNIQVTLG